jgi:1-deoxy-D-xylulose-5-phosphate synthase
MTGHAGCSVSTVLGLASGDDLLRPQEDRKAVAVIGDGAFPSGIVFEALNNAGGLKRKLLVILNDNKMSICPRVGGMADYLDRLRMNPFYSGLKSEVAGVLGKRAAVGDPAERFLAQLKEGVKAGLHGGMLFEDLGFRYIGPIDGHNIGLLRKYLRMVKR